jgi:TonB family protein
MPQPAMMGARGHVGVEFIVNRDGSLTSNRVYRSSGMAYLDRAAKNAIESSYFLPLPDDCRPNKVTMRATFYYNEAAPSVMADFGEWMVHFTREINRNWVMLKRAKQETRGHVDIEFTVERDGRISSVKILSSGISDFDKAAQTALESSHFLPLPDGYTPPRMTLKTRLSYNEDPKLP